MGFGVCPKCGGYWCSVGGYVNYCVCPKIPPPVDVVRQHLNDALARLCRNCGLDHVDGNAECDGPFVPAYKE